MSKDLVLKDKIFVYDLSKKRIGWTDYDCSNDVNVSITSSKDEFRNAGELSENGSSRTTSVLQILIIAAATIGSLLW
ncbi:aspartic proteinase-like protein 2 [Tanacetum coccineum]